MNLSDLGRFLNPLKARVANMVARGVLARADDSTTLQTSQLTLQEGEVRDGLERFQNYGFTSFPRAAPADGRGAEAAVIFVGGRRDHGLVIAIDDRRFRLKNLEEGEVALYSDEGDSIIFRRGNKLVVTTHEIEVSASTKAKVTSPEVTVVASTKVTITSPQVNMSGALNVTGAIVAGSVKAGGIGLATHVHSAGAIIPTVGGVAGTCAGLSAAPSEVP
jgi:phage baseplate assembly protein V